MKFPPEKHRDIKKEFMASSETTSHAHPTEWSKAAIASAILATLGFFTLWAVIGLFLVAIAAICGHVGRYDATANHKSGKRVAGFGLGLSYFSMFLFPVLLLIAGFSFPAVSKLRQSQNASMKEVSEAHASQLYLACENFARSNRDKYPASLSQLSGRYLPSGELKKLLKSPYKNGAIEAFEIISHNRPVIQAAADSVIVLQEIAPSNISEIAVVYADGSVKSLYNPDYEKP